MFLRWANVPSHNALILPNTVAEQFNWIGKRNPRPAEHVWAGSKVMLTVSRLSTREGYKGHDKVIRCMPALSREYDSLIYAIAGVGDQQDALQSLADSLDVGHRVRFLGRIGHEELPSLYRDADVFVMPSTGEGFGIVFLESIACGTPAIAGNCDGARDPLHDGALGVLSEDGGLTECIREALGAGDSSAENRHYRASRAESAVRHFGRLAFSANTLAVTHRALGFASEGTNVGQVDH
jgi:phosphatidylinositol alpha-1,6-mannosyltransferase